MDTLNNTLKELATVEELLKSVPESQQEDLLLLKQKLIELIPLLQTDQGSQNNIAANNENACKSGNSEKTELDDEFLKFQNEIKELEKSESSSSDSNDSEDDSSNVRYELCKVLSSMEGNKCRAPYIRPWGEKAYHNAIIFSTDIERQTNSDLNDVQVKVMFCNPTCDEMKPCSFFLDGHCKFTDDKCRFSHGYTVKFSEIEEYAFPNYSDVQRDSRCLAKFRDGLWYTAIVENCLDDQQYFVKYDKFGNTDTLAAHDILPLGDLSSSSDSESDSSSPEDAIPPEVNYSVAVSSSALGSWELHTKGIGSKLMAKMGYVWGQGLGRNSDGRLEPVEAILLPKGKSLDKCAEIRESVGPVSIEEKFNAEKLKEEQISKRLNEGESSTDSVFRFINQKVFRNKEYEDLTMRKRQLTSTLDKANKVPKNDLNFMLFSVGENIKNTKKEIVKLQQFLNRNSQRNEAACARVQHKMEAHKNLLKSLESKEQKIHKELNLCKGSKKMDI